MEFSFTLDRNNHNTSIFLNRKCYENVNPKMINGFIHNKMGIKFHNKGKFKGMPYENELTLIKKYSGNMTDDKVAVGYNMAVHKWGRINPVGSLSLSLFHRPTRHTFAKDYYVDFDMANAQPSTINQICLQNRIQNLYFMEYCKNPTKMRTDVVKHHQLQNITDPENGSILEAKEQAKKLFISLSFGGTYKEWKKTYNAKGENMPNVIAMEKEIGAVMNKIYDSNPDMIEDLKNGKPEWKDKSVSQQKRSVMGIFAQTTERMLQETCIQSVVSHIGFDLDAIIPSQDGFMILKSELDRCRHIFGDNEQILRGMEGEIKRIWDFDIKWEIKAFDKPLSGGIPLIDTLMKELTYAEMKVDFEKTHTKIINLGSFFKTEPDKDINMTKPHLITAYEHLRYNVVVKGENRDKSFITDWLKDGAINRKRDVEIIPPDQRCPDDIHNAWRPFAMEKVTEYTPDVNVVEYMLNHINILCDRNTDCYEYFIKWIAMCIQFPSIKLPMPVFVSAEGAGKGSILRLFGAILGGSKILQTQEPSQEVWGQFNSLMLNAYIVCLDEINKKEMSGCEGKIKGLITEPTMNINDKGKSRFPIKSYHKFIALSNPDAYGNEPMTTTQGDRRKFFVMCSDELIGNTKYFVEFNKYLENQDAMKTVYEYFKNLPDAKSILTSVLPESDYHKELKAIAVPPLKMFIKDFIIDNMDDEVTEWTTDELYADLRKWCDRTGIRYECNKLQFGCRLANMKLVGMKKVKIGDARVKGWGVVPDVVRVTLGI